jgi:hypothetical protein
MDSRYLDQAQRFIGYMRFQLSIGSRVSVPVSSHDMSPRTIALGRFQGYQATF